MIVNLEDDADLTYPLTGYEEGSTVTQLRPTLTQLPFGGPESIKTAPGGQTG